MSGARSGGATGSVVAVAVVAAVALVLSSLAAPVRAEPVDDAAYAAAGAPATSAEEEAAALRFAYASGAVGGRDGAPVVPGHVLVTARDDAALASVVEAVDGSARFSGLGVRDVHRLADRVALVRTAPAWASRTAGALAVLDGVEAVEPDRSLPYARQPNDPGYDLQWYHHRTNIEAAWDTSVGENRPIVAVLDSGVDATHPDLAPNVTVNLRVTDDFQIVQGPQRNDPCNDGHGTAVAGTLGSRGDDGVGVAGVLWQPRIIDVGLSSPELQNCGSADIGRALTAIDFLTGLEPASRPLVINMSWGGRDLTCPAAFRAVFDQARAAGIALVAAAGNSSNDDTNTPAACDGVISVGATGPSDQVTAYSTRNDFVDIAAPGGDLDARQSDDFGDVAAAAMLLPCYVGTQTAPFGCPQELPWDMIEGTSFSSPYIAGVVALLRSVVPGLTHDQAQAAIENTARDMGAPGRDPEYGFGLVDVGAALQAAQAGTNLTLQPRPRFPDEGDLPGGGPDPDPGPGPGPGPGPDPGPDPAPPSGPQRVAPVGGVTDPITQAIAVSTPLAAQSAPHVVLARDDEFADALAGSAVAYGAGPLLYARQTGALPPETRAEIQRVLQPGGAVILMGGTAALSADLDAEITQMGFRVIRLAGASRYETAMLAGDHVTALKQQLQRPSRSWAFIAVAGDWPDAVGAGQMAATFGIPILLADPTGLHPATTEALQRLRPERVYLIGGEVVLQDVVRQQVQQLGFTVDRLSGPTRAETSLAVSALMRTELLADGRTNPIGTVAVNMRRSFAHVLSASLISTYGYLFVPVEGEDGSVVPQTVLDFFCGVHETGAQHYLAGGSDLISDQVAAQLDATYSRDAAGCQTPPPPPPAPPPGPAPPPF